MLLYDYTQNTSILIYIIHKIFIKKKKTTESEFGFSPQLRSDYSFYRFLYDFRTDVGWDFQFLFPSSSFSTDYGFRCKIFLPLVSLVRGRKKFLILIPTRVTECGH